MNLKELLIKHKFPQTVVDLFEEEGIVNLHPPQALAIQKGILGLVRRVGRIRTDKIFCVSLKSQNRLVPELKNHRHFKNLTMELLKQNML